MKKLKFREDILFGKVHLPSSIWNLNTVFSYFKTLFPLLLTTHVTGLESSGPFWRLDCIYILYKITLLSTRKAESELTFYFQNLKQDRHSAQGQRRLGADRHMTRCLLSEEGMPPTPTGATWPIALWFAASQASCLTFTGEQIPTRSHSRVWAPQPEWDHLFRSGLFLK